MLKISLIGKKFGKLLVLEECKERDKHKKIVYKCLCDCGSISYVTANNLRRENGTRTCGCSKVGHATHGKRHTRMYGIWLGMKTRCYNKNRRQYKDYGGRGVAVCDEWKDDFQAFYNWAMSHGYNDTLTIDRIDNDGNYEPSNCRWVNWTMQQNNKRTNVNITFNGVTKTIAQWAKQLNIDYDKLQYRKSIEYFFIRDCISRSMSLHDIEVKYGITDVLGEYQKHKKMYSQDEINNAMNEVYYRYDA